MTGTFFEPADTHSNCWGESPRCYSCIFSQLSVAPIGQGMTPHDKRGLRAERDRLLPSCFFKKRFHSRSTQHSPQTNTPSSIAMHAGLSRHPWLLLPMAAEKTVHKTRCHIRLLIANMSSDLTLAKKYKYTKLCCDVSGVQPTPRDWSRDVPARRTPAQQELLQKKNDVVVSAEGHGCRLLTFQNDEAAQ